MTLSDARQHRRPSRRWGRNPRAERASPDDPHHPSSVPCPLPRRIETGARVGCFPVPRGLPRISGGSASATSLSRPAQASLALRPAGSLNRPKAAFVARLRRGRLPSRAACQLPDQTDNYLGGTLLHWRCAPSGRTEKSGLTHRSLSAITAGGGTVAYRHAFCGSGAGGHPAVYRFKRPRPSL